MVILIRERGYSIKVKNVREFSLFFHGNDFDAKMESREIRRFLKYHAQNFAEFFDITINKQLKAIEFRLHNTLAPGSRSEYLLPSDSPADLSAFFEKCCELSQGQGTRGSFFEELFAKETRSRGTNKPRE